MGLVHVAARIGKNREELFEVTFLVDAGSFYSAITPRMRDRLQLPTGIPALTRLADSRVVETEVTLAHIQIDGRGAPIPVEIANVPEMLLGVSALEVLGFKVNPIEQVLEPTRDYPEIPLL